MLLFQSPENNRSLNELDEEENCVLQPLEATQGIQEEGRGPPKVKRCGGEEGETGGTVSQRQRLNADMPDGSLVRGQGKVCTCEEPKRTTIFGFPCLNSVACLAVKSLNDFRAHYRPPSTYGTGFQTHLFWRFSHLLSCNPCVPQVQGPQAVALELRGPGTAVGMGMGATGGER